MSNGTAAAPEPTSMPSFETLSTIVTAIELFSKIPKVAAAVKHAGINIAMLLKARPAVSGPLKIVIAKECEKIEEAIKEYYKLDANPSYSEIDKDERRRRIAARLCALLKQLAPIKDGVPDYEKLVELFCGSIPKELAA